MDYDSEYQDSGGSINGYARNRIVKLYPPSVYSKRMQHVISEVFDGYYIPPLLSHESDSAPSSAGNSSGEEGMGSESSCQIIVDGRRVHTSPSCSSGNDDDGGDDDIFESSKQHSMYSKWTCIYRTVNKKTMNANEAISAAAATEAAALETVLNNTGKQQQQQSISIKPNAPLLFVLVMGVSGTGKSTVGASLAGKLDCVFLDADSLHSSASKAKMASGVPLSDDDRWPWLAAVAAATRALLDGCSGNHSTAESEPEAAEVAESCPVEGRCVSLVSKTTSANLHCKGVVLACSALKRSYRDMLMPDSAYAVGGHRVLSVIVHLVGSAVLLGQRLSARSGHFMPATLLQSQLETLERPDMLLASDSSSTAYSQLITIDVTEPIDSVVGTAVRFVLSAVMSTDSN
jgi:gluconokinase